MEKMDLEDELTCAIMNKEPLVIVEGIDDIQFYQSLCEKSQLKCSVMAVEMFTNYAEGCTSVLRAIKNLQIEIDKKEGNENFILGIIDRDSRDFRDSDPEIDISTLKGLFILKYYSYESHFTNDIHIKYIVRCVTNVDDASLCGEIMDDIKLNLNKNFHELYWLSLEALKNACTFGYDSIIGYAYEEDDIADPNHRAYLFSQLEPKKGELEEFAFENNISYSDYKTVIKGKWLLHTFCSSVNNYIKKQRVCSEEGTSCKFCKVGLRGKCMWKLKKSRPTENNQLVNLVLQEFDYSELEYIIYRLCNLGATDNFSEDAEIAS